jgi:energy-coupling factor transporter ATP-binding protein EcfA2
VSLETEIVEWVDGRPVWQQVAFLRLCRGETLSDADVVDIADQLLAGTNQSAPRLTATDIPGPAGSMTSARLLSVGDFANINALPAGEQLTFAPDGLTVVYGHNASGKSGYARLLKAVAAARHREEILGDVYDLAAVPQRAVVRLSDGTSQSEWVWPGEPNALLHQIAFYDEYCGDSYVSADYEVTYRPSALTLLDDLIRVCDRVRAELDQRAETLARTRPTFPAVPPATSAESFLASLSAKTAVSALDSACTAPNHASDELGRLLQEEARLRATNPAKEQVRLRKVSANLSLLADHCATLREQLGGDAQQNLEDQRKLVIQLRAAAAVASSTTFDSEPVRGVGTDTWRALWGAAREFSEQEAYHDHSFPMTDDGARCVLCHQELDVAAADRLTRFQAAMLNRTQQQAADAERELAVLVLTIRQAEPMGVRIAEALAGIEAADTALAATARTWIEHAGAVKVRLIERLGIDQPVLDAASWPADPGPSLLQQVTDVTAAAASIDDSQFKATLDAVNKSKDELQGQIALVQARPTLDAEVERLKVEQQISVAKRSTDTMVITKKSTELARAHVTDVVRDRFTRECDRLKLEHVTLSDVGGKKGQLRHRSALLGAVGNATVRQVLSEGEQTALGLAGFMTEAYFDGSKSALVFDDPVTSLDHVRRWEVAGRLVEFAKDRQVIVFTHDVSFVGDLSRASKREHVALTERCIERTGDDLPGRTSDQHPWNVKDVDARFDYLLKDLARLRRERCGWTQSQYEEQSGEWAGKLSQLWERMISMEIVNQVVDRSTTQVQPKMFRLFARITDADDEELQASYENCSFWATRHDKNPERNYVAPTIDELEGELAGAKAWFKRVKQYRR